MAPGTLTVDVVHPGKLVGADKAFITLMVNGEAVAEGKIGDKLSVEVPAGSALVGLSLAMGRLVRNAKPVDVEIAEGKESLIRATYSRLWGKYKLSA